MLHVWNIYQHLPHKWPSFVGNYTIHGAYGHCNSMASHTITMAPNMTTASPAVEPETQHFQRRNGQRSTWERRKRMVSVSLDLNGYDIWYSIYICLNMYSYRYVCIYANVYMCIYIHTMYSIYSRKPRFYSLTLVCSVFTVSLHQEVAV